MKTDTIKNKLKSYLGFAKKSRNLISGAQTSIYQMEKKKVKLLIVCDDISKNTREKVINVAEKNKIKYIGYENSEEISAMVGDGYKGVFAILDDNFAKIIFEQIDSLSKEKEVF